jgi:hypothetical protein
VKVKIQNHRRASIGVDILELIGKFIQVDGWSFQNADQYLIYISLDDGAAIKWSSFQTWPNFRARVLGSAGHFGELTVAINFAF